MRTRIARLLVVDAELRKIVLAGEYVLYLSTEPSHAGSGRPLSAANPLNPASRLSLATMRWPAELDRWLRYSLPSGGLADSRFGAGTVEKLR